MSKNKTNNQKHSASRRAGTKFVRLMMRFVEVQMMNIDLNDTLQIKENSP
ncbi:MAG: hypothetical protein PHQ35_07425 [Phycisphaerae bacterium]|nr:hypothetical protein [Phycisphaerae bacterium]MDD5380968.1 hypothetical protein [Phycisphaerae bacterium]